MNEIPEHERQLIQEVIEKAESETEQLQATKPKVLQHALIGCGLGAIAGPALACVLFLLVYDLNDIDSPPALVIQFVLLMAAAIVIGSLLGLVAVPVAMAIIRIIGFRLVFVDAEQPKPLITIVIRKPTWWRGRPRHAETVTLDAQPGVPACSTGSNRHSDKLDA